MPTVHRFQTFALTPFALGVVFFLILGSSFGQAQTAIMPTTGNGALDTAISQAGNTYNITGGLRPGNGPNLFHSFEHFNLGAREIARFNNTTPSIATSNILSRVTGGTFSHINGTIDTLSYPTANFYFLNPAGVIFGPNAALNVNGSVHVGTADSLNLADGARFSAVPGPSDALISAAPPVAFGFLGPTAGKVTVDHSTLTVPDGKALALVGGEISIVGGTLTASGGPIELTARDSLVMSGMGQDHPSGIMNSTTSTGRRGDVTLSASNVRLENGATIQSTARDVGSAGTIRSKGPKAEEVLQPTCL
jgi:filamentous hemagglutinin family protein